MSDAAAGAVRVDAGEALNDARTLVRAPGVSLASVPAGTTTGPV